MIEKIGPIRNPLTIIAIFAGIAEVSGTAVLPFIYVQNQSIFVWFLIIFPSLLVVIFFATLNWNHKVLYAPSDYKDEENFVKTLNFDFSKLQTNTPTTSTDKKIEKIKYEINVVNFINAVQFIRLLKSKNFFANIYFDTQDEEDKGMRATPLEHKAIWLGGNVPLSIAVSIIKMAKEFFPHIEYIHLSSDSPDAPNYIHDQIFIGGATSAAIRLSIKKMSESDFNKLYEFTNKKDLHEFVRSFY